MANGRKIKRKGQSKLLRDAWACIGRSRRRQSKRNAVRKISASGYRKRKGKGFLDSIKNIFRRKSAAPTSYDTSAMEKRILQSVHNNAIDTDRKQVAALHNYERLKHTLPGVKASGVRRRRRRVHGGNVLDSIAGFFS